MQELDFLRILYKNLALLNVKISAPINNIEPGKPIAREGWYQFNIKFGTNFSEYGIKELTEESILVMAKNIAEVSNVIGFSFLVIPYQSVRMANQCIYQGNIVARYLEDYIIQIDEYVSRWDVLVKKAV